MLSMLIETSKRKEKSKMKRECFKRGNMHPDFYEKVSKACKKFEKDNGCGKTADCDKCPFSINRFCLMNVLIAEFEHFEEDKRKVVKKKFVDCTHEDLENALNEIPELPEQLLANSDGKGLIEGVREFLKRLETFEIETVEESE